VTLTQAQHRQFCELPVGGDTNSCVVLDKVYYTTHTFLLF